MGSIFGQMIEISRRAFEAGNYNGAYHALAAALHFAIQDDNEQQEMQVETIAREQIEQIDKRSPEYEHST